MTARTSKVKRSSPRRAGAQKKAAGRALVEAFHKAAGERADELVRAIPLGLLYVLAVSSEPLLEVVRCMGAAVACADRRDVDMSAKYLRAMLGAAQRANDELVRTLTTNGWTTQNLVGFFTATSAQLGSAAKA